MLLAALLVCPLAAALLSTLAARRSRALSAWVAAAGPLAALALLGGLAQRVLAGEVVRARVDWVPQAGLAVSLRLDALAWLFAVLVAVVGVLVVLYAFYYMPRDDRLGRFYALLLAFMAAMLGVVTSGNLLLLVVCWELTSLSSFFLVGYWGREEAEARDGARTALAVTAAGGLALLGGVLLIGRIVGSLELDVVLGAGARVRAAPLYPAALGLVLLGAFTKSAQWPFHFWLPRAMAAPTPASAYLHSATMVKAGVFLLARLHPVLAGTDAWMLVVGGIGMVTLLHGAYAALWQHDLKGLLAYSTISHLGLITMLLGFGSATALAAAVFHVVNHATFKASLFMAAGIVDHEAGTRDMRVLNGLARQMPLTAALAIVAASAMAGVPLLNGFLSKEMFFAEAL
ncbi:MAG TPA: proton-conducting transporter membrane subunit, partial [Gemmatirosa sp.]|nr:proton-conducting transporter membrane subunit [Gemmatirosa sp.]